MNELQQNLVNKFFFLFLSSFFYWSHVLFAVLLMYTIFSFQFFGIFYLFIEQRLERERERIVIFIKFSGITVALSCQERDEHKSNKVMPMIKLRINKVTSSSLKSQQFVDLTSKRACGALLSLSLSISTWVIIQIVCLCLLVVNESALRLQQARAREKERRWLRIISVKIVSALLILIWARFMNNCVNLWWTWSVTIQINRIQLLLINFQ